MNKRNLAAIFYHCQKAYKVVRRDWMEKVYRWMRIIEKGLKLLRTLMEGLEFQHNGKVKTTRGITIVKGFLQGDSYSPVELCLKEVPIAMLLGETDGWGNHLCQEDPQFGANIIGRQNESCGFR